jgi:hypothetical protein
MSNPSESIKELALEEPTVAVALIEHYKGLPYTEMLEMLVVVFAKQKKELQNQIKWYHDHGVNPPNVILRKEEDYYGEGK